MVDINNKYTNMQRDEYNRDAFIMVQGNHGEHNDNPDYWNILLGDIKPFPEKGDIDGFPRKWKDKNALDFGCGCGRNVFNLLKLAEWNRVDGVDISVNNIQYSRSLLALNFPETKFNLYVNNGVDLQALSSDEYDFIMSTIVFQHICVYDIRFSLLSDLYRVLKPGGLASIQFPFGTRHPSVVTYYENYYDATGTNSQCDVRVDSEDQVRGDLEKIGFKNIRFQIAASWIDSHPSWLYIKATK